MAPKITTSEQNIPFLIAWFLSCYEKRVSPRPSSSCMWGIFATCWFMLATLLVSPYCKITHQPSTWYYFLPVANCAFSLSTILIIPLEFAFCEHWYGVCQKKDSLKFHSLGCYLILDLELIIFIMRSIILCLFSINTIKLSERSIWLYIAQISVLSSSYLIKLYNRLYPGEFEIDHRSNKNLIFR